MSIAEESLRITGLFEAELLLELMLRHWHHPLADDADFRIELLEHAAEALRLAVAGDVLISGLPAANTNLVAAIWYAEQSLSSVSTFESAGETPARVAWLDAVRHSLPSCFCDPGFLS
jgi:hypothetical protein